MEHVIQVMKEELGEFDSKLEAINCHHNYVARENHFRENVWLTRKGAVNAREGFLVNSLTSQEYKEWRKSEKALGKRE